MKKGWQYVGSDINEVVNELFNEFGSYTNVFKWIKDEIHRVEDHFEYIEKAYGSCDVVDSLKEKVNDDIEFWMEVRNEIFERMWMEL